MDVENRSTFVHVSKKNENIFKKLKKKHTKKKYIPKALLLKNNEKHFVNISDISNKSNNFFIQYGNN